MTQFLGPPKTIEELKEQIRVHAELSPSTLTKEEYERELAWGIELYGLKEDPHAE